MPMIERFKSLFSRKAESAAPEPIGETVLFNAYCTRVEIAQPAFAHKLHARRDLSDPALLEHLNGFCSHIFGLGDGEMTRDKYHVILHLQRVQQVVGISVGVADVAAFYEWAGLANAILISPEGNVVDPQGRVLVDAVDGSADPAAQVPYPLQALARKAASEAALAARGIVVDDTLPALVCEDELTLRDRDAVVDRARALLLVALRAESVASGEPIPVDTLLNKMPLGDNALSPLERAFLDLPSPSEHECAQFTWRYESLYLLEWALGLVNELPYPSEACDTASTVATLIEMRGPALRPATDILDALDLHYRLHWFIRQERLRKSVETKGVDADVVMERHRTLNWLVRFQHAPWDEVDTPT
ncbi:MAG: DUF4272 domain-containing protein [Pseudomonadota bacterium]